MAQWVNRLRNKIFVNPPPLPLLCEISGALHLAQPGITAGRHHRVFFLTTCHHWMAMIIHCMYEAYLAKNVFDI